MPQEVSIPLPASTNLTLDLALNSYMRQLTLDTPTILRDVFGVTYFGLSQYSGSTPLLESSQIMIRKLSSCQGMTVEWIYDSSLQGQDPSRPLFKTTTIQPCAYLSVITPCPLPTIVPQLSHTFTYQSLQDDNINLTNTPIYEAQFIQTQESPINLQLWYLSNAITNNSALSTLKIVMQGPYDVAQGSLNNICAIPANNCTKANVLCEQVSLDFGSGVYNNSQGDVIKSSAEIVPGRYNIAIYAVGEGKPTASLHSFTILLTNPESAIYLQPNQLPIKLPSSSITNTMQYYSSQSWSFCFIATATDPALDSLTFSLSIST